MPMKAIINRLLLALSAVFMVQTAMADGQKVRIGQYPGAPEENFAPVMVQDHTYRNIALHRAVYQASAYDYNLTGQLITDGIVSKEPVWLDVSTNEGRLPRREREWAIDGNEFTRNLVMGSTGYLQYTWHGGMKVKADRVKVVCTVAYDEQESNAGYALRIVGAQKKVLGQYAGNGLPGAASNQKVQSDPNKVTEGGLLPTRNIEAFIDLAAAADGFDQLRLELQMKGAAYWSVTELKFYCGGQAVTDVLPSAMFSSAWMSATGDREWVYVDLGARATFDKVRLTWIWKALAGRVEVSDDARNWTSVARLPGGKGSIDELQCRGEGRYVRVVMEKPGAKGRYALSEMEVWGTGGMVPQTVESGRMEGRKCLLDGGSWKLQRASEVKAGGEQIARAGFDDSAWITATVPATVLMSYVNIGALPDPDYDDNMFMISESFFNSNFWYRKTFALPDSYRGRRVFLNLDGINWKADVYLNGRKIDRVEGAFRRGRVDVTGMLVEGENVLAVEIVKNAHPGAVKEKFRLNTDFNGGILGYDNPTFHATIGWDWISTIRGRNIGIWNDVYLTASGDVSLSDPLVTSTLNLPDTLATLTPRVVLTNNAPVPVNGTLKGWVGSIRFEQSVSLKAGERKEVVFSPEGFAVLCNQRMALWWPNGYGAPCLHESGFEFVTVDGLSDAIGFKTGIRQVDYKDMATQLKIYVNGRRFIPLGGNWGFSENNLCYRGREYGIAVKYHRDMNFNMIRNWVGQTGDEEFYEACDRYGIMVWQDFWLANPCDGPDPMDERMFLDNAADYLARIRHHAAIGIYCGRNEGYPPETIDKQLRAFVARMHPGMEYISSSADDGVSGHGPYWALPAKEYFGKQTGKLHSERGMPNVMTYEALKRTLRDEHLWPQGDEWGQHDYCMQGAQRGATFNSIIESAFGKVNDAQSFTTLAQWENYDGYRAMYESGSADRMGLLIWMSHACWPSMTWQCYDYYFEPTAAFFGCKKACEPLHIQWNGLTGNMEVVNRCAGKQEDLTAYCQVIDLNGCTAWKAEQQLSCDEDTTVVGRKVAVPEDLQGVCFIRLQLKDSNGHVLSENTYVHSNAGDSREELKDLSAVVLETRVAMKNGLATVNIRNTSRTPAMMVRLNIVAADGEQVLPVDYSDNYFHLLPGEEKSVSIGWDSRDARGEKVSLEISGLNVEETGIAL